MKAATGSEAFQHLGWSHGLTIAGWWFGAAIVTLPVCTRACAELFNERSISVNLRTAQVQFGNRKLLQSCNQYVQKYLFQNLKSC